MAKAEEDSKSPSQPLPGAQNKLPPIPQGARIQKRPLTRRQLPASPKTPIIYVSARTPFISAVKRVRKHLDKSFRSNNATRKVSLQARIEALKRDTEVSGSGSGVVVTVMGTGKAVEKALAVASWFEDQGDCVVKVRTRTVGTVDDVVVDEDEGGEDESRVRKLSCLEVGISLR